MSAIVASLIAAVIVFALALDGGTFGLVSRSSLAIAVWWTIGIAVALGLLPLARTRRPALITTGLLAAFVAWTGTSIAWSASAERAFNEFNRAALYLGVFVAAVLLARSDTARRLSDGTAIGIAGVALLALATRLLPESFADDAADRYAPAPQLRYPLHYSNGLAILVGLAVPLLLRAAVFAEHAVWRSIAVGTVPPAAAVLYLTSSRGGVGVALVGAVAFIALTTRRWTAAAAATAASLGSAAAVAIVASQGALVDRPDSVAAVAEGRRAAIGIAFVATATAAVYFLGERVLRGRPTPSPSIGWATAAAVVILSLVGVASADPAERFDTFRQPPANDSEPYSIRGHLASVGSTGRWQFWQAAADQFRSAPLIGEGAGSYEAWWARSGSLAIFIVDAHSMYLETAGELGVVGLVLLVGAFGAGVIPALLALRRLSDRHRSTAAALIACFLAYALGAGIDWMWELTVVTVVGLACLGLLTQSPGWRPNGALQPGRLPLAARIAVPLLAAILVLLQWSSMLSSISVRESEAAVEAGDEIGAIAAAQDARALAPWAASPHLQLALVYEEDGQLGAALSQIREAIQRDRHDWRLWLVQARFETRMGRIAAARRSLARAAALNPRSPLFAKAG
jgi:O-Antigen ligase